MAICGAIWDMDGTLLDTLTDLHASVNRALGAFGMPERTRDEVRWFLGNGAKRLIARSVPEDTDEDTRRAVWETFVTDYKRHDRDHTAPYPGIPAALRRLQAAGFRMAVVSNKVEPSVEALRREFFADTLAVAVGDADGRPCKPAPDGTFEALRRLGLTPAEAVFVGDTDVDMETARNAGLPCVTAGWGFRDGDFLRAHGAVNIAATPEEAAEMILKLTKER